MIILNRTCVHNLLIETRNTPNVGKSTREVGRRGGGRGVQHSTELPHLQGTQEPNADSPMVTITCHTSKYKADKLHKGHIFKKDAFHCGIVIRALILSTHGDTYVSSMRDKSFVSSSTHTTFISILIHYIKTHVHTGRH